MTDRIKTKAEEPARQVHVWTATLCSLAGAIILIGAPVLANRDDIRDTKGAVSEMKAWREQVERRVTKIEDANDEIRKQQAEMTKVLTSIDKQTAVWAKSSEVVESWIRRGVPPK